MRHTPQTDACRRRRSQRIGTHCWRSSSPEGWTPPSSPTPPRDHAVVAGVCSPARRARGSGSRSTLLPSSPRRRPPLHHLRHRSSGHHLRHRSIGRRRFRRGIGVPAGRHAAAHARKLTCAVHGASGQRSLRCRTRAEQLSRRRPAHPGPRRHRRRRPSRPSRCRSRRRRRI